MKLKGLAHIGIYVSDIARSTAFYQKLGFALDETEEIPGRLRLVFLSAGSCVVELIQHLDTDGATRGSGVIEHIALAVDDIEAAVAEAAAAGIAVDADRIETIDICGGIRNVFFAGPDGEGLELFQYL